MISNSSINSKRCWNCGIQITDKEGHYCKDCIADFKNGIPLTNTYKYQSVSTEYLKKEEN